MCMYTQYNGMVMSMLLRLIKYISFKWKSTNIKMQLFLLYVSSFLVAIVNHIKATITFQYV